MVSKEPVWRPLKFKSPEELQVKIDEYFARCDKGRTKQIVSKGVKWVVQNIVVPIPYTITWLASWLWTNRQTLINYEEKEEFFWHHKKS